MLSWKALPWTRLFLNTRRQHQPCTPLIILRNRSSNTTSRFFSGLFLARRCFFKSWSWLVRP